MIEAILLGIIAVEIGVIGIIGLGLKSYQLFFKGK